MKRIFGIALELCQNSPLWAGVLIFVVIGWTTFFALSLSSAAPKNADPYSLIVNMANEQLAGQLANEREDIVVEMTDEPIASEPKSSPQIMKPSPAPKTDSSVQMEYQKPTFDNRKIEPQAVDRPGQTSIDIMDE